MSALLDFPPPFVEPAYFWVPPGRRGTYGPQIVDWTAGLGHSVDAEQAAAIDGLASFGPGGLWHALEVCIIEGRQNGKTDRTLLPITMFEFFILTDVFGADKITWTAHLMKTCRATFNTVKRLIDANPELSARVANINESSSEEAIEHVNGSVLEFAARTTGGGRGEGGKTWVGDEALILPASVMDARLPTLSARPNPQVRYASSAGKEDSEHLAKLVERGRSMSDPSLIYVEYCAPGSWDEPGCASPGCTHLYGVPGCTLDREELWHLGNHAAGRRIGYHFLRNERRTLTPRGFGRERYGWHETVASAHAKPIPVALWGRRRDEASLIVGAVAIGIDIPPSRASASIGVAGFREDELAHLELAHADLSVDKVVAAVAKMVQEQDLFNLQDGKVVRPAIVGDKLALGPLMPAFKAVGIVPVLMGPSEMAEACGRLQDDVEGDLVRHIGQAQVTAGFGVAVKRPLGDGGWLWGKKLSSAGGGDISGVCAITWANWALSHHQAQPFFGARR